MDGTYNWMREERQVDGDEVVMNMMVTLLDGNK
jgi:hypothetical protein